MNEYVADSTSIIDLVFLQDSTKTDGSGKTGLAYNTSGLTCYYKRSDGTASVAVTLASITTFGTYVSGGFKEIDATHMPGAYEFHPPAAAFASGAKEVSFFFQGAVGLAVRPIKYRILDSNGNDAPSKLIGVEESGSATFYYFTVGNQAVGFMGLNSLADGSGDPIYLSTRATDANGNALGTSANQTTIINSVNSLQSLAARSGPKVPQPFVIPATGSTTYEFDLYLWNLNGQPDTPDAAPTVHAKDQSGNSLDANLGSTTMTVVSSGHYKGTYTLAATATYVQVTFAFTWSVSSVAMADGALVSVLSEDQSTQLAAIKAKTDNIGTNSGDSPNAVTAQQAIATNLNGTITGIPAAVVAESTSGAAAGTVGDHLNKVDATISAVPVAVDTQLSGTHGAGAWGASGGGGSGAGADQCTMHITNVTTGHGAPNVSVWVTTDSTSANVFAGQLPTDSNGDVKFLLNAGNVYYLWAYGSGINPINGQEFTAVAD